MDASLENGVLEASTRRELEALASRLGQLGKQSHTSRVQQFVEQTLKRDGVDNAEEEGRTVMRLYRSRGSLTHEGASGTSEDLQELERIVRRTLMGAWRLTASGEGP